MFYIIVNIICVILCVYMIYTYTKEISRYIRLNYPVNKSSVVIGILAIISLMLNSLAIIMQIGRMMK